MPPAFLKVHCARPAPAERESCGAVEEADVSKYVMVDVPTPRRPPESIAKKLVVPSLRKTFKRFPVCVAPAVISIPELEAESVVSMLKTLAPAALSILNALEYEPAIVKSPTGVVVPTPILPSLVI